MIFFIRDELQAVYDGLLIAHDGFLVGHDALLVERGVFVVIHGGLFVVRGGFQVILIYATLHHDEVKLVVDKYSNDVITQHVIVVNDVTQHVMAHDEPQHAITGHDEFLHVMYDKVNVKPFLLLNDATLLFHKNDDQSLVLNELNSSELQCARLT